MARSPSRVLAALTAFLVLYGAYDVQAGADAASGKLLYEARCSACHESSVHDRKARKAASYSALRAQVLRWSAEVGGSWSADEINSVVLYLNQRHYRFPCPPDLCKIDQASLVR